jgi:hypothetical protein
LAVTEQVLLEEAAEVTELTSLIPCPRLPVTVRKLGVVAPDVPRSTNGRSGYALVLYLLRPVGRCRSRLPGDRPRADAGTPVPLARAPH